MGYIPQSTTTTLTAFRTSLAKDYLAAGDRAAADPRFFSVGDHDVNYLTAWEANGDVYAAPAAGELPDLSGDYSGDVHSLAAGARMDSTIYGGTGIARLGTSGNLGDPLTTIDFTLTENTLTLPGTPNPSAQLSIDVSATGVGSSGALGREKLRMLVLPPSQGTAPELFIYASLVNLGYVTFARGATTVRQTLIVNSNRLTPGREYFLFLRLVPYQSTVRLGNDVMKITVTVTDTGGGATTPTNQGGGVG